MSPAVARDTGKRESERDSMLDVVYLIEFIMIMTLYTFPAVYMIWGLVRIWFSQDMAVASSNS